MSSQVTATRGIEAKLWIMLSKEKLQIINSSWQRNYCQKSTECAMTVTIK